MHSCIAFLKNVKKNWNRFSRLIDKLVHSLDDFPFPLKSFKVFPSSKAISLRIPTGYRYCFIRDMEAHVHELNFFFLEFGDLSFSCLFKNWSKILGKNYPCKINSQCRKTESLKKEVYNGILSIFAF